MSHEYLQEKINSFYELIGEYGTSNFNGKEIWELKDEIFHDFNETEFLSNKHRQELWGNFQYLISILKDKQYDINEQNKEFSDNADQLLRNLEEIANNLFISENVSKSDFSEIKLKLSEVGEYLKLNRWISKDRRVNGWERFKDIQDIVRRTEDNFYNKVRKKISKRLEYSEELTTKIIASIDACHPNTPFEDFIDITSKLISYVLLFGFLIDALEAISSLLSDEKPKSPLKVKSDALKDIRKFISENKDDITKEDKYKIYTALDFAQEALNNAWNEYKEEQQRKKDEWELRQKEREEKRIAWLENQRSFIEVLENKIANQINAKNTFENIVSNKEQTLQKLETRLCNQKDYLSRLNDQLDDLDDKYSSARHDDFRDRVSGWIDEKKTKISSVTNDIEEIETLIEKIESDIKELNNKINNIEQNIQSMEEKMESAKKKL